MVEENIGRFSLSLREKALDIDRRRILLANLRDSEQEKDLSIPPNCNGFGRIRHFRRTDPRRSNFWPSDPLPIDPVCKALKLPQTDVIRAQVFQLAACNFKCWYCFVPFNLIRGDLSHSQWLTSRNILELYLQEDDRPIVIDLSGGQPDLVPEWTLWMMEELRNVGLEEKVYLWSDDNLSSDFLWRFLKDTEIEYLATYSNYSRVCCFKGYNSKSFSFNTGVGSDLYKYQFDLMKRLFSLKIDLYAYTTFTTNSVENIEDDMRYFVDSLQEIHLNLPLRTVPLEIIPFTPVKSRLNEGLIRAIQNQYKVVEYWQSELNARFSKEDRDKTICDIQIY